MKEIKELIEEVVSETLKEQTDYSPSLHKIAMDGVAELVFLLKKEDKSDIREELIKTVEEIIRSAHDAGWDLAWSQAEKEHASEHEHEDRLAHEREHMPGKI